MSTKLAVDICERVLATFLIGFLTAWLAAPATGLVDVGLLRAAGLAGLAAAGSAVKGLVASRIGAKDAAALLPDS